MVALRGDELSLTEAIGSLDLQKPSEARGKAEERGKEGSEYTPTEEWDL